MMVSDEEKRWLVVGIAMNKVAAPVLRDFIKQGMDTHYTNLDIYCSGLTTPCTLKTLTYHHVNTDPSFKHLKFQNVNNNFHLHGKHKNLYNYNINSSVNLGKLFLPDYLAEFSAFDESLDMSAILRLLGFNNPAPIFHSPIPLTSIQASADDVRENVRNKWGHCNVTDWTEVLFNDCFSKLETLVRSLGLTGGMEKTILDQLSDWKTKGCQLCMGHAVDKDLLSLVQREVKGIIRDLALQSTQLSKLQQSVAGIQDQQSSEKARMDEHAARLDLMEEKLQVLEKLQSIDKILSEELLRRVQGLEEVVAKTDDKVEKLEQGVVKIDNKVEQLKREVKSRIVKPDACSWPAEPFDVKTCRSKLAEHYKRTAKVPTSVWSKTSPVDIHQIYTRLSWVKEEQTPAGSSQSELSHYTDVFTANKNGVVPKRILVQGQTGIGKSTFVKKLAVDWAEVHDEKMEDKHKDVLKQFELLVAVNLKEVSKYQTLKDVLSRSSVFPQKEKHLTDNLLDYITKNQEKVLLVFDGYDEYRCGRNSEIYEIFSGNDLRNCCVLITTRISKADELREFKDVHAEITGFSEEDRKAFMNRMLGGKKKEEELSRHLLEEKLEHLTRVPLLLLFFCTLWKKLKSFPKTKTKLYLLIVQYVLDHSQGKRSPARFCKVEDFKEILAEIGKVAFECLLKDDHVFEYDQLSGAILCDESLIIGLLQVTEYAENLRPAGMVSFIHKSIQEFLAAWYIAYRCVPEESLGGIEQRARTLKDCMALENVFQFICGLSDDGAVQVFQHLTSVRMSDPTLDLSKTIPDVDETDVPLCDVTYRHRWFSNLVFDSFREVQSKADLWTRWLDCTAWIVLVTRRRQFSELIPEMKHLHRGAFSGVFYFHGVDLAEDVSIIDELLKFLDCLHVPLRITEKSAAFLIGDFLRAIKTVVCKRYCGFSCILRFHNGQTQFYITGLFLRCDDHARSFTKAIDISAPSRAVNLCSKQSCLRFLRSLHCVSIVNAQTFKDLGAVMKNCKYLKSIIFFSCDGGICELLEQVPNPGTCSLTICETIFSCQLTSAEAESLAGVLQRFNNITSLGLELRDCSAAAVNKLVSSITHKTVEELALRGISLTPAAAAALGRSLPEMSSLQELVLSGADGSNLQAEEMEALFGGFNKTFPALKWLHFENFNARGRLAPLTERLHFFPNLDELLLSKLNMDERDLRVLLESLRSSPNMRELYLGDNPLGDRDTVYSIVQQALPGVDLEY